VQSEAVEIELNSVFAPLKIIPACPLRTLQRFPDSTNGADSCAPKSTHSESPRTSANTPDPMTDLHISISVNFDVGCSPVNPVAANWARLNAGLGWPGVDKAAAARIREIITRAFEAVGTMDDLARDIREALGCSVAYAKLIADTEISQAQVGGNFEVWRSSGLVGATKWMATCPCPACAMNDGLIRKLGEFFPSGHIMPLAHPGCRCYLMAVDIGRKETR
jgi:hypothetical protein